MCTLDTTSPVDVCRIPVNLTRGIDITSLPLIPDTTCIDLDVTDRCNLSCRYCFKNDSKPNNMALKTAQDSITWLFLAGAKSDKLGVNFMGGEPLLRYPMLRDLVDWGNRRALSLGKRISWSLTTNVTLFNEDIRKWVDEKGIGVLLSFDGVPEVQDSQRPSKDGKPKAGLIATWARSMLRTRPKSDARMTITPQWVHCLYASCMYVWREIGFESIVLADASYPEWTDCHFSSYEHQLSKIVDFLVQDFIDRGNKSIAIFSYLIKKIIIKKDLGIPVESKRYPCGAGYNYSMIDHTGSIWPCHRFDGAAEVSGTDSHFTLGNIYSGPYRRLVSNAFRYFDHTLLRKSACDECPIDLACGGFCPAANLSDTGNIYIPHDSYCRLKSIAFRYARDLYYRTKTIDAERCISFFKNIRSPREA